MTTPDNDTDPPFPKHRRYYVILKIAVLAFAVAIGVGYLIRYA